MKKADKDIFLRYLGQTIRQFRIDRGMTQEGLTSANEIISITYDTNHGCYVVFWVMEGSEA